MRAEAADVRLRVETRVQDTAGKSKKKMARCKAYSLNIIGKKWARRRRMITKNEYRNNSREAGNNEQEHQRRLRRHRGEYALPCGDVTHAAHRTHRCDITHKRTGDHTAMLAIMAKHGDNPEE